MTAPRPQDPDVLFTAFVTHCKTCDGCRGQTPCPYGDHLLEAWGDSERFYAAEQAHIDEVLASPEGCP